MKSVLSKVIIAGLIGLAILLLAGGAGARTFTVDDSGGVDFTKIQEAINYASAGDTILVYSGTYQEKVVVTRPLILKGIDNGGGQPVVKAKTRERPDEIPIALISGSVTLDGFRTEGGRAGIYVILKNNVIINNTAFDNEVGIYLNSSSNNTLNNNTVLNNKYGIYLVDYSNSNYLDANTASDNDFGIYQVSSNNNTLSRNNVSLNKVFGLYLSAASNNTIYNNVFKNEKNFMSGSNFENKWNITKTSGINTAGGPNLGGNFWADTMGTGFSQICADKDSDGICDSPYDFHDPYNIDYLPLSFIPTATKMTLTVDDAGGADYRKIQDAINNAKAGATILVYRGIYDENVIINKPLILKGIDNGWGGPIIQSIILKAGKGTFDGFKTMKGDHSLVYKPFIAKLMIFALIISIILTIVMVDLKKDRIRTEIASANINAIKSAIKDLIIGSIKGIFVGLLVGGVISQIMINFGFFDQDPGWAYLVSMIMGVFIGAFVGAIAGIIKDVNMSVIAGTILGVVFESAKDGTTIVEFIGAAIGVVILGGLVGSLIGRAVFNDNRKGSMKGAIIGGIIGIGNLGSIFTGIIIGSLIGGVIGLLAGRVIANKKAIPIGIVSGLISSAIAGAITGVFFQVEALYISLIVSQIAGAIIGGTICLYFGANKQVIVNAGIVGMIAGSAAGLIGGGVVIDWILIMNQNLNEDVFIWGSIGAVVGGISGALQTRKNILLESAVAGSIGALIGAIAESITGYYSYSSHISPIAIPIAGAIIGGIISMYSGTRKYTLPLAILGGIIAGVIFSVVEGLIGF